MTKSLAAELERTFATRKADEWESELVAQGVACVEAYGMHVRVHRN